MQPAAAFAVAAIPVQRNRNSGGRVAYPTIRHELSIHAFVEDGNAVFHFHAMMIAPLGRRGRALAVKDATALKYTARLPHLAYDDGKRCLDLERRKPADKNIPPRHDAAVPPRLDAAVLPRLDAAVPPRHDAAVPPRLDAAVPQRHDAAVLQRLDAAVPQRLDAAVPPRLDAAVLQRHDSATYYNGDVTGLDAGV